MVFQTKSSVLKLKEGKYVTVKLFSGGPQLCAVDCQNEEPSVDIWRSEGNEKNQMAFRFHNNEHYYFPTVNGNKLTLEEKLNSDTDNIPQRHLFEKENMGSGDHYGLRSVVKPHKYLKLMSKHPKECIFTLSEQPAECVLVIDERKE